MFSIQRVLAMLSGGIVSKLYIHRGRILHTWDLNYAIVVDPLED